MGLDRLRTYVAAAAVVLAAGGCFGGGSGSPPRHLLDGSPPGRSPDGTTTPNTSLVSRVRVVRADALGPRFRSCVALISIDWPERTPVVERIGAVGGSITIQTPSGEELLACDETGVVPDDRDARPPWCGVSAGQLFNRRLIDPRLDIGCQTRDGALVAFAWVEPPVGTFWVGVDQGSYVELYRPAEHRPIRVATTRDVHLEGSKTTFHLSFYRADGRKIGEQELATVVAG